MKTPYEVINSISPDISVFCFEENDKVEYIGKIISKYGNNFSLYKCYSVYDYGNAKTICIKCSVWYD